MESVTVVLQGESLIEEKIHDLDFFQLHSYLTLNTVLLARYFHYRVELLLIFYIRRLGKVNHHAIWMGFLKTLKKYIDVNLNSKWSTIVNLEK